MITKGKLENLYKSGLSLDKIAKIEKLSRGGIKYWMEKYNIPTRPRYESCFYGYWGKDKNHPLPKILTTKEVKKLYHKEGLSAKDIAKLFNRSSGGVYRFMKSRGLIRRLPSETNNIKYNKQEPSFKIKNKLRIKLYCYGNQNSDLLKKYWSKNTDIPLSQFIKPYVKKDFKEDKIDKMKYGLIHIRYSDKKLFLKIKEWTEEYLKSINF